MTIRILAAAALAILAVSPALAQDAAAGKTVFNKCKACHTASEPTNKVGPHLVAIAGKVIGSNAEYAAKYSAGLTAMGAAGKAKEFNPDSKMAFAGLSKPEDIANVIAYLKADPKP